ncbi:MAG: tRNA pseudouridine(38-40) synthase TruA [Acidobacteria bacterium]|nr:tRNA pseudouridine(38-40) synthase TruA [Acidobacteriota bacterium]
MPRYKLIMEYAGTRYSGWQIQKNARTVQGELHHALQEATRGRQFETYGSGRTDAGVHALGQVVHVDLPTALPPDTLVARINDHLPHDINVLSAERMPPRFHARHSAVARRYRYQISRRRSAFEKNYVWWVREPLNLARMREAASHLVGFADFRSFTDDDPEEKSTHVLLQELTLTEQDHLILVHVTGSHFLWKMVRRIVGVLVGAGKGDLTPGDVGRLLQKESPLTAQLTAPAAGLFLERVEY